MSTAPVSVLFLGTPEIAARCLGGLLETGWASVKLVITQPDRPAGRGSKLAAPPVKELAIAQQIPVLQPLSIRKAGPEFITAVREHGPFDIGVVVAFGQILPLELLQIPRAGSVNVHTSLLPRWRGAAPMQRAILAGDTATGVCLMQMEEGLDTGPVYCSASVPISAHTNFGSLHDALTEAGKNLLVTHLREIVGGSLSATPQSLDGITYANKIKNEEAEIDWHHEAQQLDRQIRAFSPFPGAFTWLNGKRLKIFAAKPVRETRPAAPGSIVLQNDHWQVVCGTGSLELLEVQLEGKKRMDRREFLRGGLVHDGTKLGKG